MCVPEGIELVIEFIFVSGLETRKIVGSSWRYDGSGSSLRVTEG